MAYHEGVGCRGKGEEESYIEFATPGEEEEEQKSSKMNKKQENKFLKIMAMMIGMVDHVTACTLTGSHTCWQTNLSASPCSLPNLEKLVQDV